MEVRTDSITARQFFDGRELHGPTRITLDGDIVVSVDPHNGECDHHLVTPGLVDLQVNGWRDVDFATAEVEGLARVDDALAGLGTTSYLATLTSDDVSRMRSRVDRLCSAGDLAPGLAGVHLEGPFLGRMTGAHRRDRIVPVDMEWLRGLPSAVRLVTIGAEQTGAPEAVRLLTDKGVTVSIGHSSPSEAEFVATVEAGAAMVTHLFNAMSGVHHRDFGLALAALTDPRLHAGLIADMCHVSPRAVALAFAARPEGICLVSDAVAWESESFVRSGAEVRDGAPRLPDGTLAGSSTCLAECVRSAVQVAGVGLAAALRAATSTPASLIGAESSGSVRTGRPCDLVFFGPDLSVVAVRRRLVSSRGIPTDD